MTLEIRTLAQIQNEERNRPITKQDLLMRNPKKWVSVESEIAELESRIAIMYTKPKSELRDGYIQALSQLRKELLRN